MKMSHQMLDLMASPMKRDTGLKTVNTKRLVALDPNRKGKRATRFEAELAARVVSQERPARKLPSLYQVFQAGLTNPTRPLGTMLYLGPTGSGKTHVVEAAA